MIEPSRGPLRATARSVYPNEGSEGKTSLAYQPYQEYGDVQNAAEPAAKPSKPSKPANQPRPAAADKQFHPSEFDKPAKGKRRVSLNYRLNVGFAMMALHESGVYADRLYWARDEKGRRL